MILTIARNKPSVTERLLAKREQAGESFAKHTAYHALVSRYQRWVLKIYLKHRNEPVTRRSRL